MQSLTKLTVFLCSLWALTLLYGEMFSYWVPLFSCSWPSPPPPSSSSAFPDPVNIAVIADPQIMDWTSLGLPPKSFALEASQFYTDIYLRRAFRSSILPFGPDVIVFLGDQFDGGPWLSDQEWQESLSRFKHIFGLNDDRKRADIPVYYLSGNHDIGYSRSHSLQPEVFSRFEKEFGARNYHFSAGMVEFVAVDAQTLDGPVEGVQTSSSWEFVNNMSKVDSSKPRVLLTHIPLYRADGTPCGPYRSSPVINQKVLYSKSDHGIRYQNYLSQETSTRLLDSLRPILVLSGHDHDQCTVTHSTPYGPVPEHTLGTVSWQQGNLYPSFMLVTASSPSNTTSSGNMVSTCLCFLPMQTHIYIWYLSQFVLTLLLLIIWPTNGFGWLNECMNSVRSIGRNLFVPLKEKDDEDCEYEMIWDAEGAAHLVRKVTTHSPAAKPDGGSTARGNATIRQTAKKAVVQDPEASVSMDMNSAKVTRPKRSMARKIIGRLMRVVQLISIIAAVNGPLYMMLLFKDWVER